jgi:hypothetical protein
MERFGREGRFMSEALKAFDHKALREFFADIGVKSHAPDGYRVFPVSHSAVTIITALENEMRRLGVEIICSARVTALLGDACRVKGVCTLDCSYESENVIIATGGMGYPQLGAEGDGYELAKSAGHHIKTLYPAMMPLQTKERWVKNCRADTIAKAQLRVDLKKEKKLYAEGDLIFTNTGIRGPVVLDFAREVTPLIEKYGEVPLLINMIKGLNEEQLQRHFKVELSKNPHQSTLELLKTLLPEALCIELCHLANVDAALGLNKQEGKNRAELIKIMVNTPLSVVGHEGFKMAMITRGGISLQEIDPKSMQSRLCQGLYFCGEVMDLDGPCGGYNLQWSFASGFLAGHLSEKI